MSALLQVSGLRAAYTGRLALDGIDLSLDAGEVLAVVGESGCGKTSLARCLTGLLPAAGGRVVLGGEDLTESPPGRRGRRMQMVFQDPRSALNPRLRVATSLAEALPRGLDRAERAARIARALGDVELDPEIAKRRPGSLSGGQAQRVAIARALLAEPQLLICDEAVSALDLLTRQTILDLLRRLQAGRDQALLFIAHDLEAVRQLADQVAVMYAGRIVETGSVDAIFHRPTHPYTCALLAAIPSLDGPRPQGLAGEAARAAAWQGACAFAPRCDRVGSRCRTQAPSLAGEAHRTACWYPIDRDP